VVALPQAVAAIATANHKIFLTSSKQQTAAAAAAARTTAMMAWATVHQ